MHSLKPAMLKIQKTQGCICGMDLRIHMFPIFQVHKVSQDRKEFRDILDHKGLLVILVHKEFRDILDHKGLLVILDPEGM